MWKIGKVKENGKKAFKANYWKCVAVGVLSAVVLGTAGYSAGLSGYTNRWDHDDDQKRHNKKCDHTVPETAQHFLIGMLRASPSSAWSLLFCLFHNLSPYFLLIQS